MPLSPGFPRLRATKVTPLLWLITVFSTSLVGTGWGRAEPARWVQVTLAVLLGLTFVQFLFAYNYLLIKDRPALESEEHAQAMARIAKGITGDNDEGFKSGDTSSPRTPDRK